jgi:hypothetical protein
MEEDVGKIDFKTNSMATVLHRFSNEMQINYPCKWLILGTFNPGIISNADGTLNFQLIQQYPDVNIFYSRPRNHFWYYIPKVFAHKSLKHNDNNIPIGLLNIKRRDFLVKHDIFLYDIIQQVSNIEIANIQGFEDSELENGIITFSPTIDKINLLKPLCVFTTFSQNQNTPLINEHIQEVKDFCLQEGIHFAHLPTPGGYGPIIHGSREVVLQLWKEAFGNSGCW